MSAQFGRKCSVVLASGEKAIDLSAQRADHHVRREEILKRRGLVSDGPGRPRNSEKSSQLSYARQASETLGISKRTVEKDLARGKRISPDVLAEVTGTDLDKGVVLDELARTLQPDQRAKLAEITERRSIGRQTCHASRS